MSKAWSKPLICHWKSWTVVNAKHLLLELPADNYCDMDGAVRVAKYLLPGVEVVSVYVDSALDMTYAKHREGWVAFPAWKS